MRTIISVAFLLIITACSTSNRFIVSDMGYEPVDSKESMIYALPQTSLKVGLVAKKDVFIPGPYADYALKLLGISGVQKSREEVYTITSLGIEEIIEPDADRFFSINLIEGILDLSKIEWVKSSQLVITDDFNISTSVERPLGGNTEQAVLYTDVTMESNVELKKSTIYKTILTDTSFIKVPVTSEQMERKTMEKKAEEAARLILEIRADRYYIAAGLLDPYPANFDMKTALQNLDRLEAEYLTLFIGKSYTENISKEYFITPEGTLEDEIYNLDAFSREEGIGGKGGTNVKLRIRPVGNSKSFRNLLPQEPESESYNRIYYRIPEICELEVSHDDEILFMKRANIYQSGALVNIRVGQEEK